jgi:cell division protein FtsQ
MDGRRRLAQPVKGTPGARTPAKPRSRPSDATPHWRSQLSQLGGPLRGIGAAFSARLDLILHRVAMRVSRLKPRYFGATACVFIILGSAAYGTVKGDHLSVAIDALRDMRDATANAAGFHIANLTIIGRRQMSEAEVLAAAGVTERSSLLFLDVEAARQKLESTPWIAQATVRKLYPGHLEITVQERDAYALWQKAGKLFIIAADGAVLAPVDERAIPPLPLVVGPGAAPKAREFLELLGRYASLRSEMRAAVLVADRRWNLKLKSGLDIRLPETGIAQALDTVVALDRDKKLLSRDITGIDLRLADRVTVRLSDEAAAAREQSAKEREKKKKKGGPA